MYHITSNYFCIHLNIEVEVEKKLPVLDKCAITGRAPCHMLNVEFPALRDRCGDTTAREGDIVLPQYTSATQS
ncbi:hypothetical protein J6590_071467 [Homalodisca vitripennis]|nr:hypothetical protein J6590_071467 [Homalodisca vitripennis]